MNTVCLVQEVKKVLSQWWSFRPLFRAVMLLKHGLGLDQDLGRALRLLDLQPNERVLDIHCGCGESIASLAHCDAEVIVTDVCRLHVEAARQEIRDRQLMGIRAVNFVNDRVPLEKNSCDAIICRMGLTSSSNPARLLAEAKRVLKPGGRMVVIEYQNIPESRPFLAGIVWPAFMLLGINPNKPWEGQVARLIDVHLRDEYWNGLRVMVFGTKKAEPATTK